MTASALRVLITFLALNVDAAADTRFNISYPAAANGRPIIRCVYVMISRTSETEPRLEVGHVGVPFFGRDVKNLRAGREDDSRYQQRLASKTGLRPSDSGGRSSRRSWRIRLTST